ncbi:MFS transporter [Purpureocillium lilacinum]|uniref:MFS transporter n=2 Tax=Purpureocillium lilacinum TaxID=33203 RepID=A0A179HJ86_PURLI|nr:MFS transporter [Purpureocillium lilacinum]OAQ89698.1 MFS transporter [Purpureocillium lilacinum]
MASIRGALQWICRELGLTSVWETGSDAWLVILGRTCRMFAFGAISLIIALFMSSLNYSDFKIGLFMTLTLVGDVILSLFTALVADHTGRRRILILGGMLMVFSGLVFVYFENYWILLFAAVVGVISATGGDFGPFRSIEESTLSHLTEPSTRADVLSWYVATSTLGSAVGTEVGGRMVHVLQRLRGGTVTEAYHDMFWIYALMGALSVVCALFMSDKCESPALRGDSNDKSAESDPLLGSMQEPPIGDIQRDVIANVEVQNESHASPSDMDAARQQDILPTSPVGRDEPRRNPIFGRFSQISKESLAVSIKLWILLAIDSLADGMVSYALTNYYLARKFGLAESALGDIMSTSYLLMAISSIFAGPLARHLGLINTMVFTHLPSSTAVLLFPIPQSVALTVVLLFIRTGLNNMDQGPRAAFIAAVVKPEERTAVMGITGMLRTLASTIGPSLTGWLAGSDRFWIAFVVAGALRIGYDLGLFVIFVNMKLHAHESPEEHEQRDEEAPSEAARVVEN